MSEVEARLAEIRERAQHGWPSAVHIAIDARWLLDQLARVRTDTASLIADAIEAEPNSHRVHFTDEDGNKDYVDQAHGSKHYAAIARRVGETS